MFSSTMYKILTFVIVFITTVTSTPTCVDRINAYFPDFNESSEIDDYKDFIIKQIVVDDVEDKLAKEYFNSFYQAIIPNEYSLLTTNDFCKKFITYDTNEVQKEKLERNINEPPFDILQDNELEDQFMAYLHEEERKKNEEEESRRQLEKKNKKKGLFSWKRKSNIEYQRLKQNDQWDSNRQPLLTKEDTSQSLQELMEPIPEVKTIEEFDRRRKINNCKYELHETGFDLENTEKENVELAYYNVSYKTLKQKFYSRYYLDHVQFNIDASDAFKPTQFCEKKNYY